MVAVHYGSIESEGQEEVAVSAIERSVDENARSKGFWRHGDIDRACAAALLAFVGLIAAASALAWSPPQYSLQILSSTSRGHTQVDEENIQHFFTQRLDHFDPDCNKTWLNRYYQSTKYFGGPGKPIFMVIGGEDAMDDGMYYPFVNEYLAKQFQAAVIQIEHRFYGPFQPIQNASTDELLHYLTVHQALADMVEITKQFKIDLGCDPLRSSPNYCPVISVGASYPGFLSAMCRFIYPDFVDIAYASSAPLLMYAQEYNPYVFYDTVTDSAERASPGCAEAVRSVLLAVADTIKHAGSLEDAAARTGICGKGIPPYIKTRDQLKETIFMVSGFAFADFNMINYPPGPGTYMSKACSLFENVNLSVEVVMNRFFHLMVAEEEQDLNECNNECGADNKALHCFDLTSLLPDKNPNTTLEDTAGDYEDGKMWDFQTCTEIIFIDGFSKYSMFPERKFNYKHLYDHCQSRFGVTPRPFQLVNTWHFDKLETSSYILFTNGLQDIWSGGSVLWNVSDTVLALNFQNGAHHSELRGPTKEDTEDIKNGFLQISGILETWLDQVYSNEKG